MGGAGRIAAAAAFEAAQSIDLDGGRHTRPDRRAASCQRLGGGHAPTTLLGGHRPAKRRNLAIAEWSTSSGQAGYMLFVGLSCVGAVESKPVSLATNATSSRNTRVSAPLPTSGIIRIAGSNRGRATDDPIT